MKPDSSAPTIAVIGSGLGGTLLVSELGLRGYSMRLADRDAALIEPIAAAGGIEVTGRQSGFVSVEMATTDTASVVRGTPVILVSTAATEHRSVAATIAPHLSDGQLVLLIQGHFGGALEMRAALAEAGCAAQVTIAEMDMFPFFGGKLTTTHVELDQPRIRVGVATLPASKAEEVTTLLQGAFPMAKPRPHVLCTGFADLSPLVHSVPMILNINTVEGKGDYAFYGDMMSGAVVRVIERCDAERLRVAASFGVILPSIFEYYSKTHQVPEDSLLGVFRVLGDTTFRFAPAPKRFDHRYITQDLGVSMVGWSAVAGIAGVEIPTIDSIVELAGVVTSTDFHREGRNAARLGFQSAEGVDDVMAAVLREASPFS